MLVRDTTSSRVSVSVEGSLLPPLNGRTRSNLSTHHLIVWLGFIDDTSHESSNGSYDSVDHSQVTKSEKNTLSIAQSGKYNDCCLSQNLTEAWTIPILPQDFVDFFPNQKIERIFELDDLRAKITNETGKTLAVNLETNLSSDFPISIGYDFSPINAEDGTAYAAVVLLGLYILIIFEVSMTRENYKCLQVVENGILCMANYVVDSFTPKIVHRALAAMLASTMSLAILAMMNEVRKAQLTFLRC